MEYAIILLVSVIVIGLFNYDNTQLRDRIEDLENENEDLKVENEFYQDEIERLKGEAEDLEPYVDFRSYRSDNFM